MPSQLVGFVNQASKDANISSGRYTPAQANAVPVGGGASSRAPAPAYNAQTGATTGTPSAEYDKFLESLNKAGAVSPMTAQSPTTKQPSPTTINATAGLPGASGPGVIPPPNTPLGAAQSGTPPSTFQQGFANVKASGISAPDSQSSAAPVVQKATPQPQDTSGVDMALANDKGYQNLLADQKDYNDTKNQQTSLLDFYNKAIKEAGIPAMNTELLNTKKIIDGTETDIRKEVQAANGFATDSQVLALSGARNKQLILNYNNLLDTKNMAMENIKTMVGLEQTDQQTALNQATQKLQIDEQINSYRDKFVANANEGFNKIIGAVGYKGLYNGLMNTDPTGKSLAQAEQTMGLPPGQLQQLAKSDTSQQMKQLDLKGKQLSNASTAMDIKQKQQDLNDSSGLPNPAKAGAPGYSDTGIKYTPTTAQNEITAQWTSNKNLDKNGHIPPADYNTAKAWWVEQGLNATQFDNILGRYKQEGLKGYN